MKLLYVGALLVFAFMGCSERVPQSKFVSIDQNVTFDSEKSQKLRNRFIAYWDARSRHEFDKSYEFELPYIRFLKDEDTYKSELSVTFKGYETVMTKLEFDDKAQSRATVYRKYIKDDVELRMKTRWYYVNGRWYRAYDFSLFPKSR